jgi:hypothetical protein
MLTDEGQRWLEQRRQARSQSSSHDENVKPAPTDPYADVPPPDEPPGAVVDISRGRKRRSEPELPETPKRWKATDLAPAAQPRWLAKNRLPRAAVSLLIGDEGIGKSLLWVKVATHITTGEPFPGFGIPARDPGHVILISTEDDWATAVRPRLEVVGADLDRIEVVCVEKDGSGTPIFPLHMDLIRGDPKPDLVVVDCWLDTVPAGLSVRDAQEARRALHPWRDIATETDAAIWLLAHSNRVAVGNIRDRYGATYVLRQKARMSIYAMADEHGTLLAGPEKANGAITVAASCFRIKPIPMFQPTLEQDGTVPLLEYEGESKLRIREHVEAAATAAARIDRPGDPNDPVAWLVAQLDGGPRWSAEVKAAAKDAGLTAFKLRTAKQKLNVQAAREAGTGPWFWRLPQHVGQVPGVQMSVSPPISHTPTSEHLGKNQMLVSTSTNVQMSVLGNMDTPSTPEICACGEQLTTPASIRYGACQECRLTASKDSQPSLF